MRQLETREKEYAVEERIKISEEEFAKLIAGNKSLTREEKVFLHADVGLPLTEDERETTNVHYVYKNSRLKSAWTKVRTYNEKRMKL